MKDRVGGKNVRYALLLSVILLFLPGCLFRLNVAPLSSLKIDPKEYQPVVLMPIPSASDHPGSALYSFLRDNLKAKGYILVEEAAVSPAVEELGLNPLLLLSDSAGLIKLAERVKAKLVFIGTMPEYKFAKPYWGARSFQVWDQPFEYATLPTYYFGTCQIRVVLRIFEAENGELVWGTEGTIRAPSANGEVYAKKLAERLLEELPSAFPPSEDKK